MTVLLSTALLAATSMATAQTQAVPAASAKSGKHDTNRMVCKTLPTTGSRLKPNRDCRTVQQWEDAQALDRRDLDRIQTNRSQGGS